MRKDGHTLQSIANEFGCTREWIRLILKNEIGITQKYKFDSKKHCKADEYSAQDIVELTGYHLKYISILIKEDQIPIVSRIEKRHKGINGYFWKKTDIDKWIELKIKYLKIALEGYITTRLVGYPIKGSEYYAKYKITHPNIQKRYKLLLEIQSGNWKGKLSYRSQRNDLIMKEFYGDIKPFDYIAKDYSKYLNQKTKEDYAQKGLFNSMTTAKEIQMHQKTIVKFRKKGILKEGIHFIKGDHYYHRYMYYPEKTKQAILNGGYDVAAAARRKRIWAKKNAALEDF